MIDINFFKNYNDALGHQDGDKCLQKISDILKISLKRVDNFSARFGGEEFVVVLTNTKLDGTLQVANKKVEINTLNMVDWLSNN